MTDTKQSNPPPDNPPPDTAQSARDAEEKRKHSPSENALRSSQDKNPIPPDSIRHS